MADPAAADARVVGTVSWETARVLSERCTSVDVDIIDIRYGELSDVRRLPNLTSRSVSIYSPYMYDFGSLSDAYHKLNRVIADGAVGGDVVVRADSSTDAHAGHIVALLPAARTIRFERVRIVISGATKMHEGYTNTLAALRDPRVRIDERVMSVICKAQLTRWIELGHGSLDAFARQWGELLAAAPGAEWKYEGASEWGYEIKRGTTDFHMGLALKFEADEAGPFLVVDDTVVRPTAPVGV